ncbi:MAG: hypothetical protein IE926_16895 [Micrococcales bacterium]|nr:hypothetical protein [Micrococcales bacterium]
MSTDKPEQDTPLDETVLAKFGPRAMAGLDLLRRTGVRELQFRFSDEPAPVLWLAYGEWPQGRLVAAAFDPGAALLQLVERAVDGGTCKHCRRPTVFLAHVTDSTPLPGMCAYQWDPELAVIRRSCEGNDR